MTKITNPLTPDSSQYFTQWGSRNVKLAFREELDNILGAKPTIAGIKFDEDYINNSTTMHSFNDGMVPNHSRVAEMYKVGRTMSNRHGVSICGVGQIEALIAGRKRSNSTATLRVEVVYNGEKSVFVCVANGENYSINCEYEPPIKWGGHNKIEKTYTTQKTLSKSEIEELKIIAAVKIYPYILENPNFKFIFNDEQLDPIDVLYGNVSDDRIKRFKMEYEIEYHEKKMKAYLEMGDFARYIKPNGFEINEANKFDEFYNMSKETSGVFLNYDNNLVVYGGESSWNFVCLKWHSTHSGQKIMIKLPIDENLKDAIFSESPNKNNVSMDLGEIVDYDGSQVFGEMLNDIKETIRLWTDERSKINNDGNKISTEKEKAIYNEIIQNKKVVKLIQQLSDALSEEQYFILSKRKVNTLFSDTGCTKNKVVQCTLNV